jgi:hypothetical protein
MGFFIFCLLFNNASQAPLIEGVFGPWRELIMIGIQSMLVPVAILFTHRYPVIEQGRA